MIFTIFIVLAALEDFTGITISPEVTKTPEDAPTQSTASEETEYALFQERLRAGADCPRAFSFSCLVGKAHHVESFAEMGIVAA